MDIIWSGKPGNADGQLCPGAGTVLGLSDVSSNTAAQWAVNSANCDARLLQADETPLAGPAHNVMAQALPLDLTVGGSFTVTATATVAGKQQTASITIRVHPLQYIYDVAFPGIPTLESYPQADVLRVGGNPNLAAEQRFTAVGSVTLQGGCRDSSCAWTQLRLGFAQSIIFNYRVANYSNQAVLTTLPGQQADGTVTPPVRDSFSAVDFFASDARTATFASYASQAVTRLRDSPSSGARWTDPASGNLEFVRMRNRFAAWLVLRHDRWFNLFAANAVRYVCNFTWSVEGTVWVDDAVAHTLEGMAPVGSPDHTPVLPGQGQFTALFGGSFANGVSIRVPAPHLNEVSPLREFYQ
jgi:hypothetical protein